MGTNDISLLLQQARDGSNEARDSLFSELYSELRSHAKAMMHKERGDHTLQATALVNEACLKLLKQGVVNSAENRRELLTASIGAMRQVLIDHSRTHGRKKRGCDFQRQPLDVVLDNFETKHDLSFLDLDEALKRLQEEAPDEHEALSLRFFAGLTIAETAEIVGCSESTVEARWRVARAKLTAWLA